VLAIVLLAGCQAAVGPTVAYGTKHGLTFGWEGRGRNAEIARGDDQRAGRGFVTLTVGQMFRATANPVYALLGMDGAYEHDHQRPDFGVGGGGGAGIAIARGDVSAAFGAGAAYVRMADPIYCGTKLAFEAFVGVRWIDGELAVAVSPAIAAASGEYCEH
jgi:hypothetical protein